MILKLAEQGKLRLDDSVLSHLGDLKPLPEDAPIDPRFKQITIRHCLMNIRADSTAAFRSIRCSCRSP